MERLKGKSAIVTGGGRGLGKVFCVGMAEEGAMVTVADILDKEARQTADHIKAKGGSAIGLKIDVTSEKDTFHMAEETISQFGRIDILINNAAMIYGIPRRPSFVEIPTDEWDKLMAVNLKGPFLCAKAVFPQMKKQGKGKIINISSDTALTGSHGFPHYVASKGGVISLTRSLASELGQYGICVNTVAPGFTETEATRKLVGDITKYDVSRTPLRRLEQPNDLVGAIIFFASDESDFITGQTLPVNGGRYMN